MLDRQELTAVERGQKADAGVDRLIAHPVAVEPPDHHRACAAVTFGTAFLAAVQAFFESQPVEQRHRRIDFADLLQPVAQQKTHRASHHSATAEGHGTKTPNPCLQTVVTKMSENRTVSNGIGYQSRRT